MFKSIITTLFALGALLAPASSAFAEELLDTANNSSNPIPWIQISPVSNRINLKSGQSLDYVMSLTNSGEAGLKYVVYAAPYSVVNENYDENFSDQNARTQLSRWIKFYNDDNSLVDRYTGYIEPGAKKSISYRVSVPEDIPAGGQYAAIFVQTDDSDIEETATGVKTISRLAMVVYGNTNGETNEVAEISEFKTPFFLTSGPINVSSLVKNNGNTDFQTKYSYAVKSITGGELCTEEDERVILPDTSRRSSFSCEEVGAMGIFQVTYKVEVPGQVKEETHLVIILPIYMIIIAIILLTLIVVWTIILVRKRRERKSRLVV